MKRKESFDIPMRKKTPYLNVQIENTYRPQTNHNGSLWIALSYEKGTLLYNLESLWTFSS